VCLSCLFCFPDVRILRAYGLKPDLNLYNAIYNKLFLLTYQQKMAYFCRRDIDQSYAPWRYRVLFDN